MRIKHHTDMNLEKYKSRLLSARGRLNALNPRSVLNRGYSILKLKDSGEVITSPNMSSGTEVNAILKEGEVELIVK